MVQKPCVELICFLREHNTVSRVSFGIPFYFCGLNKLNKNKLNKQHHSQLCVLVLVMYALYLFWQIALVMHLLKTNKRENNNSYTVKKHLNLTKMSYIPSLTLNLELDSRQWAAVRTQFSSIRTPPQWSLPKWLSIRAYRIHTMHYIYIYTLEDKICFGWIFGLTYDICQD